MSHCILRRDESPISCTKLFTSPNAHSSNIISRHHYRNQCHGTFTTRTLGCGQNITIQSHTHHNPSRHQYHHIPFTIVWLPGTSKPPPTCLLHVTFLYSADTHMAKSQVTIKITIINHESMSHTSNYERLSLSQMDIHTSKLSSYLRVTGVNRYSNHP